MCVVVFIPYMYFCICIMFLSLYLMFVGVDAYSVCDRLICCS